MVAKVITTILLVVCSLYGKSQTLTANDSIKIAMYHAGINLRNFDGCNNVAICTQSAGAMIFVAGLIATNDNRTGPSFNTATVYIGSGLMIIGSVVRWLAPSYAGKAGLNLKGIGFEWEIPNSKTRKEDY